MKAIRTVEPRSVENTTTAKPPVPPRTTAVFAVSRDLCSPKNSDADFELLDVVDFSPFIGNE
jgi:hypothetical protein